MSANTVSDELEKLDKTCDELLELSRAHQRAVASGDLDLLNRLLEQRGRLISCLDLKRAGLAAGSLRIGAQAGPSATRQSLVLAKLRELLRMDEESKRELQIRVDEVKTQLAGMSRGRQALHQYSCIKVRSEPVYVDSRQ